MIKRLMSNVPKKYTVIIFVTTILWTLFESYFTVIFSRMTGDIKETLTILPKIIILFSLYILLWEIVEYVSDVFMSLADSYIPANITRKYFNEVYTTKSSVIKKKNSAYISGLVQQLQGYERDAYRHLVISTLLSFVYIVYIAIYSALHFAWQISVTVIGVVFFSLVFRTIGTYTIRKSLKKHTAASSELTKVFMDATENISTVKKLECNDFIENRINDANEKFLKTKFKLSLINEFFFTGYKFLSYMIAPACFVVFYFIRDKYEINSIEFVSFISLIEMKMVHVAKEIAHMINSFGIWKTTFNQVNEVVGEKESFNNKTKTFETIEIKNAIYEYNKVDQDNNITPIKVSIPYFRINKGEKVCITGKSGQGKTTTLNLISGELESNNIYVDGKISSDRIDAVYIAQDIEMFDMSLRDNLTLGKNIPDKILLDMIEKIGMSNWYQHQKDGLDTILGERGVFLSTGQRQRLNLIRGLLIQDKELYLLDEPTSNVDEKTERKIIDLISTILKNKTVIIVTHRKNIKSICDKEYEFKKSKLCFCK